MDEQPESLEFQQLNDLFDEYFSPNEEQHDEDSL